MPDAMPVIPAPSAPAGPVASSAPVAPAAPAAPVAPAAPAAPVAPVAPVAASWRPAIEDRRRACRDVPGGCHLVILPGRLAVHAADAEPSAPGLDGLVVDLAPGLRARRRIAETHGPAGLTDYGAYAASRDLIEALRGRVDVSPVPDAALVFWDDPAGADPDAEPRVLHPGQDVWRRVFGASVVQGGAVQAFESRDPALPTALAFAPRGPASGALTRMLPFLCPRFSRLVTVTSPDLFLDLAESEQPGAVFNLLPAHALADPPSPMRRDFEAWSGLRLPLPAGRAGAAIRFQAGGGAAALLGEGWSAPEPGHTWAVGPASTLVAPEPLADCALEMALEVSPCVFPPAVPAQRLEVEANGTPVGSFVLTGPVRLTLAIPAPVRQSARRLTLRFVHPDFVTPSEIGAADDDRPLAVCFGRLELRPKPD